MFMIPKYRSRRSFARLAKTSVVCRRIAEANALPSAKRVLLIVVPSILSADTRFPAASTTTTAMFKFWSRMNATAPSMMTRASAREISGGAKVGPLVEHVALPCWRCCAIIKDVSPSFNRGGRVALRPRRRGSRSHGSAFDAVGGSSTGTEVPWMWVLLRPPRFGSQAVTTIGLDTAKSVFQVHGIDAEGNAIIRRKLTPEQLAVLLKAETEKWSTVIKKANIALD